MAETEKKEMTKQGRKLLGYITAYYETGDEHTMEKVFVKLRPYVLGYLGSKMRIRDPRRREDIGQEVLALILAALRSRKFALASPTTGKPASILAYSCTVCFHYVVSLSKNKKEPAQPGEHEDPFLLVSATSLGQESEAELNSGAEHASELLARITQAVLALPRLERVVMLQVYYRGLAQKEAAERLGMNRNTFRCNLSKALTRLKKWAKVNRITSPPPEVYAALSRVDSGDLFHERQVGKVRRENRLKIQGGENRGRKAKPLPIAA